MMCVYCKSYGASRGPDGIALCASCSNRFTEGVRKPKGIGKKPPSPEALPAETSAEEITE
jgi:ribosomal protein L37AE/L43A